MAPMTHAFVENIESFAAREGIDLITFRRGQRKEDIAKEYLEGFKRDEDVLFIGKAQEKAKVIRTERRRNPRTGAPYAWLVKSSTPVNQYYFYCGDTDFGLFFIKFCSYFPYNGKLCINGHEYLKRQLRQRRIRFRPLDNGVAFCSQPEQMQQLADQLDAKRIDALARKWFRRLPHPFRPKDRAAGFRYDISILQAEFSLTQVFDRPLTGRLLFEQIIRDNLDVGRPEQVQLIRVRLAEPSLEPLVRHWRSGGVGDFAGEFDERCRVAVVEHHGPCAISLASSGLRRSADSRLGRLPAISVSGNENAIPGLKRVGSSALSSSVIAGMTSTSQTSGVSVSVLIQMALVVGSSSLA